MKNQENTKESILFGLSRMMVPQDMLEFFEIASIKELNSEWQITLEEKKELVPAALSGKADVVLDGFCNPKPLLSHGFSLKPVYLILRRRRWKIAGTDEHFSNEYGITDHPAKLTNEMAGFFKR